MSQTTSQRPLPTSTRTFRPQIYQSYAHSYRAQFAIICLLCGLYGVLAVLSIISVYALATQRTGRMRPTAIMLCLTILALFTSTTIFTVTSILRYQADSITYFFLSGQSIWSYSAHIVSSGVPPELLDYQGLYEARRLQSCASATTLTINVILGDAIVCWRACVVWQNKRVVRVLCGLFLFATFVMGGVGSAGACVLAGLGDSQTLNLLGTMFEREPSGIGAYAMSLATNLLATLLVAYKAWQSRRRLREYLVAKVGGTQVEKLMTLLVECGFIFSSILAVVVAYQVCQYRHIYYDLQHSASESAGDREFLSIFGIIVDGAFVPAIAIYPTIIIVLVALNRSHMERGLTQHLESLPTPHIALTVDAMETSLRESHVNARLEVPVKDDDEVRSLTGGDALQLEAASRRNSEGKVLERTARGESLQCA